MGKKKIEKAQNNKKEISTKENEFKKERKKRRKKERMNEKQKDE